MVATSPDEAAMVPNGPTKCYAPCLLEKVCACMSVQSEASASAWRKEIVEEPHTGSLGLRARSTPTIDR